MHFNIAFSNNFVQEQKYVDKNIKTRALNQK